MYYQVRRVLNLCSMPTPLEAHHNPFNNPYDYTAYQKIVAELNIKPDAAMKSSFGASYVTDRMLKPHYYFRNRFYGMVDFGSDYVWYVKANDWVRWINPNPRGFNKLALEKISESVRVYIYLVLTSQANARSRIVGDDASALNAQQIFKDNFESVIKRRVDLAEDIKCYQDVLDKASSKVDLSVGEGIYMMPSDMNLRISDSVAGYNNKILISLKGFGVGKNKLVNNKNNLIVIDPVVTVANKPTVEVNKVVNKPSVVTVDTFTQEEEIAAVGVTLAIIAGIWMIYK